MAKVEQFLEYQAFHEVDIPESVKAQCDFSDGSEEKSMQKDCSGVRTSKLQVLISQCCTCCSEFLKYFFKLFTQQWQREKLH